MLSRAFVVLSMVLLVAACAEKKSKPPLQSKETSTPGPTVDRVTPQPKPSSDPTPLPSKPPAPDVKPVAHKPTSLPIVKPQPKPPVGCKVRLADQITKIAPYRYRVNIALFDRPEWSGKAPPSGVRIIPYYKLGQFSGFKLVAVRPDSFYRLLGIKSGDVITQLDGKRFGQPASVLTRFAALKKAKIARLRLTRRLRDIELVYELYRDSEKLCVPDQKRPPSGCQLALHIQTAGKLHLKVSRTFLKSLDRLLKHPLHGLRMIPTLRIGRPAGLRLSRIQPGSCWSMLGLQNGDVISQFAGKTPSKPSDLKRIFKLINSPGRLTLVVEHRGKSKLLEIEAAANKPATLCLP